MIEKALIGGRYYWAWIVFLLALIGMGVLCFLWQLYTPYSTAGLGRDIAWGLHIAQFTFFVGVAASGVMVVLPYYLHDYKAFGKLTILGELLAIASLVMCLLFIFVDVGQPFRLFNVVWYPSPTSMMSWDVLVINGYLFLNIVIAWVVLGAETKEIPPPRWVKPLIYLSIPWAISTHMVTAFIYAGLSARPFWMTAELAPKFLASAFSSGPALLILLCLVMRKLTKFDAGKGPIQSLALIVTYAMILSEFLFGMELFTTVYSAIPDHVSHLKFLFFGLDGNHTLVPWSWASQVLGVLALVLLINPRTRRNEATLTVACVAVFASLWIDKGLELMLGGLVPSPFHTVPLYIPSLHEILLAISIYAIGAFIITALFKMVLVLRGETA